jgi:hypothetical protein
MPAYRPALEKLGALQIQDLQQLCSMLDDLRKPSLKKCLGRGG